MSQIPISEMVNKITLETKKLEDNIERLEAEIRTLEKQPMIFANEHWAKDEKGCPKYLYLIFPLQPGQKQKKQYIGSKKEKIKEAIDCLERAKHYQLLKSERQKLLEKIKIALNYLSQPV